MSIVEEVDDPRLMPSSVQVMAQLLDTLHKIGVNSKLDPPLISTANMVAEFDPDLGAWFAPRGAWHERPIIFARKRGEAEALVRDDDLRRGQLLKDMDMWPKPITKLDDVPGWRTIPGGEPIIRQYGHNAIVTTPDYRKSGGSAIPATHAKLEARVREELVTQTDVVVLRIGSFEYMQAQPGSSSSDPLANHWTVGVKTKVTVML